MAMLKLSAPWMIHYRKLNALFADDEYVHVVFDENHLNINLYVDNHVKASALDELLRKELHFGDQTLTVTVITSNAEKRKTVWELNAESDNYTESLFDHAFAHNPAFSFAREIPPSIGFGACYVVFKKKVVQYFNDNLSDINGVCSTLYQDIAKDVLKDIPGVFYCTDTQEADNILPF